MLTVPANKYGNKARQMIEIVHPDESLVIFEYF